LDAAAGLATTRIGGASAVASSKLKRLDQPFRNGQAKAQPGRALSRTVYLLERIEDAVEIALVDSDSFVGDRDLDARIRQVC
jgi:hypothetical protein